MFQHQNEDDSCTRIAPEHKSSLGQQTSIRLAAGGCLDFDIDTGRQAEFVQRFDGPRRRLLDVDQSLVCANFKLLTCLLVDVWSRQHGVTFNPSRQRNRSVDFRVSPLGGLYDFCGTLIEH